MRSTIELPCQAPRLLLRSSARATVTVGNPTGNFARYRAARGHASGATAAPTRSAPPAPTTARVRRGRSSLAARPILVPTDGLSGGGVPSSEQHDALVSPLIRSISVWPAVQAERLAQLGRAASRDPPGASQCAGCRPPPRRVARVSESAAPPSPRARQGRQSTQEHRTRLPLRPAHDVGAVVHAVGEVDVQMPGWSEHRRVPRASCPGRRARRRRRCPR